MVKKFQVGLFYLFLLVSNAALLYMLLTIPTLKEMYSVWLSWVVGQALCYFGLGLGFALPIVLIALTFTWFQLILIANGVIQPHLASKDFAEGFLSIFKNFVNWILK